MKLLLSLLLILVFHLTGYSQVEKKCNIKFEHSVTLEAETTSYFVNLKLVKGNGDFKVQLFDMGKNDIVGTYNFDSDNGVEQIVFKGLKRGRYLLGISQGVCHQDIGGIKGFKVE